MIDVDVPTRLHGPKRPERDIRCPTLRNVPRPAIDAAETLERRRIGSWSARR
jgi:hypothetical protein